MPEIERPIYRLRLQPLPRVDAVKMLRMALKALLRRYQLKCLSVELEPGEKPNGRKDQA
jgi:hypothetical protein